MLGGPEFLDVVRRCRISYAGLGTDGVAGLWVIAGDQRFVSYLVSVAVSEFDVVMRRLFRLVEYLVENLGLTDEDCSPSVPTWTPKVDLG
jgi:hypothetical protein